MHVTNPNGTDLKLNIKGRPVLVSDGVLSDAERKTGGVAANVYLPAGEVYTTPVAGSAEGKVVQTHTFFRGKPIDNLTLTVSGGKVTAMTGSGAGWADYKAAYDASTDPRKDAFGFVDLGINPTSRCPPTARSVLGSPRAPSPSAPATTLGRRRQHRALGQHPVPAGQHRHPRRQDHRRQRRAEDLIAQAGARSPPCL